MKPNPSADVEILGTIRALDNKGALIRFPYACLR